MALVTKTEPKVETVSADITKKPLLISQQGHLGMII